ncbi:MAG: arylsulfatase A family [Candidatus Nanosalina sp. J07AB43]|jgi:Arylsulfatase A and related enzymes|nr:MAG: arylsulfatase A family [Candidatus Nanosalina sp. J07AB43]
MATENTEHKNVIFIVLDTLRKDKLSVYDDEVDFTDNIQQFAENSKVYTNVTAQAPWTLPSHASIFTGQYPWDHEATHKNTRLDTEKDLLAEKFQSEGYDTYAITPNTWISRPMGTTKGFEHTENFLGLASHGLVQDAFGLLKTKFESIDRQTRRKIAGFLDGVFDKIGSSDICKSRETVDEVKNTIKDIDENEKFFLFTNLMSAHEPYEAGEPPKKYLRRHGVKDISSVPDSEKEYFRGEHDKNDMMRAYDASVDYTDDLVGEILECAEESDLLDDTIIVLASDHGQAVGQDGFYGHQFTVMDSVVDVPLIIQGSEIDDETMSSELELKSLYNILPNLAGIQEGSVEDEGKVKGGYERPELFINEIPEEKRSKYDNKLRYVKDNGAKMVKKVGEDDQTQFEVKYNNGSNDLKRSELRDALNQISEASSEPSEEVDDEEVKQRLEDLGYM